MAALDSLKLIYKEAASRSDAELLFVLRQITAIVCAKCNRSDVPLALEDIIVQMAADYFKAQDQAAVITESAPAGVSSITRGDTTISYTSGSPKESKALDLFVMDYKSLWGYYRKARGIGAGI